MMKKKFLLGAIFFVALGLGFVGCESPSGVSGGIGSGSSTSSSDSNNSNLEDLLSDIDLN